MKIVLNHADLEKINRLRTTCDNNYRLTQLYSRYLVNEPRLINRQMVEELTNGCGIDDEYAFKLLLSSALGLDTENSAADRKFEKDYLFPSIRKLDVKRYTNDPYYKNIKIDDVSYGSWKLKNEVYEPYQAFICDDIFPDEDFKELPILGFFSEKFVFPTVLENDNEWMTLSPVDLDTCVDAIELAKGKVVTFGLGLGYYTYRVSQKPEVEQITVVDKSEDVIGMFEKYILPQFPHREKVKIVHADAFEYAKKQMPRENFSLAFMDTWRDVSDGFDMYLRMKKLEYLNPNTHFMYWVEGMMLSHLRWLVFEEVWNEINSKSLGEGRFNMAVLSSYEQICELLSKDSLRRLAADLKKL